jgi:hypothetical protein
MTTARQLTSAYRAGWNRSSSDPDTRRSLDEEEDRYRNGRTAAQLDAWLAGWTDYAADYTYGHALTELLTPPRKA